MLPVPVARRTPPDTPYSRGLVPRGQVEHPFELVSLHTRRKDVLTEMLPLSTPLTQLTETVESSPVRSNEAAQSELSTYWMPLCEPIYEWASFARHAERVPALTAIGHAYFALAHETRALRSFTLAWKQQQGRYPKDADYWYTQAGRALMDATHHWSRAACVLDTLTPDELTQDDLDEARRMSRAARAQQERLWQLTDEVRAAIADWREQHQQPAAQREEAQAWES